MENAQTMEEYFFTEAIEDLFAIKSACSSTRIINFSYENKPDENSIYVWALFNQQLKRILFSKSDLKNFRKIYKTIKIYFGPLSVNLICNKDDNKDNIVLKINNSPNLKEIITKKLNINQYPLNKFVINEWKVFNENFDEIYKLEFKDANNYDNIEGNANINPKIILKITDPKNKIIQPNFEINKSKGNNSVPPITKNNESRENDYKYESQINELKSQLKKEKNKNQELINEMKNKYEYKIN